MTARGTSPAPRWRRSRPWLAAATLAAAVATALTGCGDDATRTSPGSSGTPATPGANASTAAGAGSPSGSSDASGSALDRIARAKLVLAAAGLDLPPSTASADVTEIPKDPYTERYLVTLSAPKAQLDAMCKAAGLGGPFPAVALTAEEKDAFGMQNAPQGARLCTGLWPKDFAHQREVLYVGDPATVWIAVWRMPSR